MKSIELFAGGGGLALGLAKAGFNHQLLVEKDSNACQTLRLNQSSILGQTADHLIVHSDVSTVDFRDIKDEIDLLAGGPPCQPFSHGGLHRSFLDQRDLFPQFVRVVRELKPKVFLVENVKGLLRQSFAKYFEYIILQLTYPELTIQPPETWIEHLSHLEQYHTKGQHDSLSYRVIFQLLNAADYGVPQRRERVFIVGIRSDLDLQWSFPQPSHSQDALLWQQWITGQYWRKHQLSPPKFSPKLTTRIQKLQSRLFPVDDYKPWLTVRDTIGDLPEPTEQKSYHISQHIFNPGARVYPGHTGSPLDQPAKTLKAGVHGVPGGENMIQFTDGNVRYFTVREAARLQTFPDHYQFYGSWTKMIQQLGNAVPVHLSEILAKQIYAVLTQNTCSNARTF